jgi:GR25 family glycosyltransferase involved in LPS biosynthesis
MNKIDWNKYFDKIFCIHFLPYKDRENQIIKELNRIGIDDKLIEFSYTYPSQIVNIYHIISVNNKINLNHHLAETSCALGHYNAIQIANYKDYNRILIIEDDISFLKNIDRIYKALENMPNDYDLIMLDKFIHFDRETYHKLIETNSINDLYTSFTNDDIASTGCYVLTKKGIDDLSKMYEQQLMPSDVYFRYYQGKKCFINNNIAIQNQFADCMNLKYYGKESMNMGYEPIGLNYNDYNLIIRNER